MIDGIINVYKEKDFTSHDVVAKLRGILKQRKIGHTGTLDPMATGVLPVCLGKATKLVDMLSDKRKEYIATFVLGKKTDTLDISGKLLDSIEVYEVEKKDKIYNKKEGTCYYTKEEVIEVINSFKGEYMQVPPMYSAKKINGKKLVDLAREGIEVERKANRVNIYELEILEINIPYVKIRVLCSKGTYIRSLCSDIGEKLSCMASMTELVRTKVDNFLIDKALKLSDIENIKDNESLLSHITLVDRYFDFLPSLKVKKEFEKLALNGNKLEINNFIESPQEIINICYNKKLSENKQLFKVYTYNDKFLGIYEYVEIDRVLKVYKFFSGEE